ncbi:hypothetical protein OG394_05885 [Kribbella sp. NBC_01245]|uniref:hypothetical protein n=1 Tax=Kribbella sp. NBC_01245 TaxID=2903578 RepID=UPI002E2D277F|nr:hypothetical protein [Kribbella sp. NBC_01245]
MSEIVSAGRHDDGLEPPSWEIPGLIALERIVSRSDDIAISVGPIQLYTTGALLTLNVRFHSGVDAGSARVHTELLKLLKQDPTPSADRLSLRVDFDDQVRTNLDSTAGSTPSPRGPRLDLLSGGSQGSGWTLRYWVSPAPIAAITVQASWSGFVVPIGEVTIPTELLQAARDSIQQLR